MKQLKTHPWIREPLKSVIESQIEEFERFRKGINEAPKESESERKQEELHEGGDQYQSR